MCGIAGIFLSSSSNNFYLEKVINDMTHTLQHRGPDDFGTWINDSRNLAFGHRRLSVIDLSTFGKQPMHSISDRYVIVYNGEIYNYLELKQALLKEQVVFRSNSDTEVILSSIELWGLEKAIDKLVGMFAFALWDKRESILYLVRDRVGKKPLYWGYVNKDIVFSSELKAICLYPEFDKSLNYNSIASFLQYGYINAPDSIYNNIYKIEPGTYAVFKKNNEVSINTYWTLDNIVGKNNLDVSNEHEEKEGLELLLKDAVSKRMISDVPVGVMLSGGIDSSLITALMQSESNQKVKSYTIGFNEKQYDESKYAKKISEHIGTDHHEFFVESDSAIGLLPNLQDIYDEPFADSSQIPTYIVSNLLKQQVTVALSGDGGDEVFTGYSRYFWGQKFSTINKYLPYPLRFLIAHLLHTLPPHVLDSIFSLVPDNLRPSHAGERLHKIATILKVKTDSDIYSNLVSLWNPQQILLNGGELEKINLKNYPGSYDMISAMQYYDMKTYLPGDILVKVDRASMANSLETRSPLLDHRVIEYAWNLDKNYKIQQGKGKFILREILYKYVPKKLIERPKMGFGVPISTWLRGPLKEWAYDLLHEDRIKAQAIFEPAPILETLNTHTSYKRNFQYPLWTMLMFQSWYDRWIDS